ncbi:DNA repair protein RecO [Flavobacterium sp. ASW18X]|uniref:DNA repair protein RecO n=1 Tax=Flavobacterium sp. ASW18X TaxID=2572595 RepID=UPI0010ADD565|nr:DNA repair protein RecO [Flavobacterium sp. ASW18X]TKD65292.1 DNA repair protein RecO [Flavobacterium sp. ASW18X]
MLTHTKAIVLSALKYGDTSLIVKAYTQTDGLKSYLLKGVLASKKGKLKAGLFQPLTQLELVANHKNKGTLETLKEAKVSYPYKTIHTDIIKNSIVLFLAEVVAQSVQEGEEESQLFQFLERAFIFLDQATNITNFPLAFLLHLSRYLGFYPDDNQTDELYFDLLEGEFLSKPSLNPLLEAPIIYDFKTLLGTKFDAYSTVKIKKANRQELLNKMLLYFELHLHGFRKPKSLAVLNAVFN